RRGMIVFDQLRGLLNSLFGDITSTFITLFAIGILICGLLAAFGGEENQAKFKRGLFLCISGLIVFLLARPIVYYFQSNL
ncbi:hypothetical protein, partial [Geobacillus sp. C56-T2]